MRVVDRVQDYEWGESFTIYGLGDLHVGAKACDVKHLRRDVAQIAADPSALWVGLGDFGDLILPGDKRFNPDEVADEFLLRLNTFPAAVTEFLVELLRPIAPQCVGVVRGNHDHTFAMKHSTDVPGAVCTALSLPYMHERGVARIRCKRNGQRAAIRVGVSHGSGGGMTAGSAAMYLERQMRNNIYEVNMCGHFHRKSVVRYSVQDVKAHGQARLVHRERVGVSCGSYLHDYVDGVETYSSDKGYADWGNGMVAVVVDPEERTFEVRA